MGNFLENYSSDKLSNALNMLKEFRKTVKYFKYKPTSLFGDKVCLFKLISVEEDNSDIRRVKIKYIGVEIYEPHDKNEFPTLKYGPQSSTFELTRLNKYGVESTNLDGFSGINDLLDFFSRVEVIDEIKAKEVFSKFQDVITKQVKHL